MRRRTGKSGKPSARLPQHGGISVSAGVEPGAVAADWKPRFFTVWASQAVSLVGSSVAGFALVWWLTETTGSANVLMASAVANTLPLVFLGPLAGTLADRWNRRLLMMAGDGGTALVSAWLAYLFWTGQVQPWHVFVLMAARSLGSAFHFAAFQSSIVLMVPDGQLTRVNGLNQTIRAAMSIVSPPLGALLMAVTNLTAIMALDVVTAATAVALLGLVTIPQPKPSAGPAGEARRTSVWEEMVEGLRYVMSWRALAMLLGASALLDLVLNPPMYLMPLLITDHFGGDAGQLAIIESFFSVGLVVGGVLLAAWGGFRRRMVTVMVALIVGAVCIGAVSAAPSDAFWLAVAGMAGFGFTLPLVNGPVMAVVQAQVDPAIQGRVMTLMMSISQAAVPVGLIVSGPLAEAFGVRPFFAVAGLVFLAAGLSVVFIPELLHFEHSRRSPAPIAGEMSES